MVERFRSLPVAFAAIAVLLAASPVPAQTSRPPPTRGEPAHAQELAACKATGLLALSSRDASIKDIEIDEEGLTVAVADTKVEDTPVRRIIMGDAYLQTNRQDKPRRFLCLIGDKGKVLLTFFTQN
jgi:hypothetical protein